MLSTELHGPSQSDAESLEQRSRFLSRYRSHSRFKSHLKRVAQSSVLHMQQRYPTVPAPEPEIEREDLHQLNKALIMLIQNELERLLGFRPTEPQVRKHVKYMSTLYPEIAGDPTLLYAYVARMLMQVGNDESH
jgi:hypothetical protein